MLLDRERFLNDSLVPLQSLAEFLYPLLILVRLLPFDKGHAKGRLVDHQPLVLLHLEAHLPIESYPCATASLFWKHNTYLAGLW